MDLGGGNQADMSQQLEQGTGPAGAIELYERFRNCTKPLIARINGPALGGGWGLVFTADIRVATKDAWFWFAEVKRGLVPAIISAYIVPQIGAFRAKEYMLTGKKMSAQKAYELGFVSALVENEQELDAKVNEYVEELLSSAPTAMADIKHLVNHVSSHSHEDNLNEVEKVFGKMVHSEEALYGMSCFAQKKKPDWAAFHNNEKDKAKL
ncbi:enoylCoA hydratase/isomerase, putative [Acanthamoeba castellanii str. Neff]|uniref:EnoylCoA hydratase/isomerase, putative n=1 Tax=Acanthamoeba castellanii (strain ATCC 30010 / Neff) TaxID=1257118 RepID=L8GVU7_ACACF|nr:enoylCoA hydratase/isomerase, putative [Acanthamoeba castellanii str. Neff]ELR17110.1 enoylCoA hydratase/isomerase, putative [Acanthamoeba castellanii str. Neff]